jgi:hypothetical protein
MGYDPMFLMTPMEQQTPASPEAAAMMQQAPEMGMSPQNQIMDQFGGPGVLGAESGNLQL